jgi:transposase
MAGKESKIIELRLAGLNYDEIADRLKTGRDRISRCLHIYGTSGQIPAPRPMGRPPKLTDEIRDFIDVRTIQNARLSGFRLAHEIAEKYGVTVHPCTISRERAQLHFDYQPPRHIQDLNDDQKAARREFCAKYLQFPPEMLHKIAFSDESRAVLGTDKQWVWYRKGEGNASANVTTQKFPPSLMIFAVIGIGYKSKLLIIEGTVDAHKYIDNLVQIDVIPELDAMHGPFNWIFQQDGAPCHTAATSIDWLEGNCDVIIDWPANSPDLSPIELLWAILKKIVSALAPQSIEELKQILIQAWDSIDQSTIDRLCMSFRTRLETCLAKNGESISNDLQWIGEKVVWDQFAGSNRTRKEWTEYEDRRLLELRQQYGPKWKLIAKFLPDREAAQVKNHWYTVVAKRLNDLRGDTEKFLEMRSQIRRNVWAASPNVIEGETIDNWEDGTNDETEKVGFV